MFYFALIAWLEHGGDIFKSHLVISEIISLNKHKPSNEHVNNGRKMIFGMTLKIQYVS